MALLGHILVSHNIYFENHGKISLRIQIEKREFALLTI